MLRSNGLIKRVVAIGVILGAVGLVAAEGHVDYAQAAPATASASAFTSMTPQRLVDTRNGTGGVGGRLAELSSIDVPVTGRLGIPTTPTAVEMNTTAVDSGGRG